MITGPYAKLDDTSDRIHKAEFKPCDRNDVNKLQRFRLQKLTKLVEVFDGDRSGYCKIDEVESLGDKGSPAGFIPQAQSFSKDHYSAENDCDGCKQFCTQVSKLDKNAAKGFLSASESNCCVLIP